MKTLEYRNRDKTTWGDGPWQDELDRKQWPDPATGLPCLITRNFVGALCGYVGVPEGHPLYGKSYDEVNLEGHGGINFSAPCDPAETPDRGVCHIADPDEPDHVWWFGFDCSHCFDLTPATDAQLRQLIMGHEAHGTYRDLAYVTANVTSLAAQLKALA